MYSASTPAAEATAEPESPLHQKIEDSDQKIVTPGSEQSTEYRDQDGKLLNEDEAKSLEGKVQFETKYETRTRVVDVHGNEIANVKGDAGAPPHPDTERHPETSRDSPEDDGRKQPVSVSPEGDLQKEKSAEGKDKKPRPASEAKPATQ
jgi:dolichyl-phosphate-mannose-protein mannosyltransferase